jgi:hypothetical protein
MSTQKQTPTPIPTPKLEVLFQEDNHGQGPLVAEIYWYQPGTCDVARVKRIWDFLTVQRLNGWCASGVNEVLLQHRGGWHPALLYR